MNNERFVIFPIEIQLLTGLSRRSVQRLVKKIRQQYKLPPRSLLPLAQFCEFTGYDKEEVKMALGK